MPTSRPGDGWPLLNVVRVRASAHGLDDVSLQVHAGTRHIVVADRAAGTTLLEVIAGIGYPDRGQVYLDGEAVTGRPLSKHTRENIGYLPAIPNWYAAPTVHGVLQSAVRWQTLARRRPTRGLTGAQQVTDMLGRCGLIPFADHRTEDLPPGYRRLVDLAVILLHRPRLILVDQADTGLAGQLRRFHKVLADLPDHVAVLATLGDLTGPAADADHVTVIDHGRVVARPPISRKADS